MLSSLIFLCQKRKNYNKDMIHHDSLGETFSNFKTKVQWILNCSMIFLFYCITYSSLWDQIDLSIRYDNFVLSRRFRNHVCCQMIIHKAFFH